LDHRHRKCGGEVAVLKALVIGRVMSARVVAIGECMVELARGVDGRFTAGYGGDTFNTAVYLARLGVAVAYATKLGDDPYSQSIVGLARAEHVATDLIAHVPGRNAGLYLIETTPTGERSFHYWRDRAPARELFDGDHAPVVAAAMKEAKLVYLSGITLSLYDARGLDALEAALVAAKTCGARVAIDGNYRPRGWGGDQARARTTFERFFRQADVALPTFDDEQMLWGDARPDQTLARMAVWGIAEVALKRGADGALIQFGGHTFEVPCPQAVTPLDTTAAGDSFNAAYLAARLGMSEPAAAALAGHRLAARVIQHRGAIIPQAAMGGL
jgi:2-dehydro-3-deoxygluconokinase